MRRALRVTLRGTVCAAVVLAPVLSGTTASAVVVPAVPAVPAPPGTVVHGPPPGARYNTPQSMIRASGSAATTLSFNWSGYGRLETGATSAAGSWTVPRVATSVGDSYSASWVGVDGYGNQQLIQTGTGQDSVGGVNHYYAWWEILPEAETPIPTMAVTPGDKIAAGIRQVAPQLWTITLQDLTSGASWSATEMYAGSGGSAEWIEEAPTIVGAGGVTVQSTLADFGALEFGGALVDGVVAGLALSQTIDMVDFGTTDVIASTSAPRCGGEDFAITYGAGPPPAVTVPCAPGNVRGVPGQQQVAVSWQAPTSAAGAPVTSYTVTVSAAGLPNRRIVTGSSATSREVTGLVDGEAYSFSVAATDSAGTGDASTPSSSVKPGVTTPGSPTDARARATRHNAVLHWRAPAHNGGSPLTGYTVTVYTRGIRQRSYSLGPSKRSLIIRALGAHTPYTFGIAAVNGAGTGPGAVTRAATR